MAYPTFQSKQSQTQTLTIGRDDGYGPTIDLGQDALGIIGLITGTLDAWNFDGGTPSGSPGAIDIVISLDSSFDGIVWSLTDGPGVVRADDSVYYPWAFTSAGLEKLFGFGSTTDLTPLLAHAVAPRFIRFKHVWANPADLGVNASATITLVVDYF